MIKIYIDQSGRIFTENSILPAQTTELEVKELPDIDLHLHIDGKFVKHPNYDQILKDRQSRAIEHAMPSIMAKRNAILNETAWTQASDCHLPESKIIEFAQYRADVLSATSNIEDIDKLIWPTPPTL